MCWIWFEIVTLNKITDECELTAAKALQFKAEVNNYMGEWFIHNSSNCQIYLSVLLLLAL